MKTLNPSIKKITLRMKGKVRVLVKDRKIWIEYVYRFVSAATAFIEVARRIRDLRRKS